MNNLHRAMWIGLLTLASQAAHAYDTVGSIWPEMPIPYWIDGDLDPDVDEADAVEAMQKAFRTWEDAGCGVSFSYQGRFDGASYGDEPDGENVVYFVGNGWPEDPALLTSPRIVVEGADMLEVDFALNGQHFAWDLDNADGNTIFDVQAATTHEAGHLLGLWHSTVTGATLNPALSGHPDARSLSDDDIEGLCTIYDPAVSEGLIGDECTGEADCLEGLFCLADGPDQYCTRTCADDEECGVGFTCADVPGGTTACAVGDGGGCGGCSGTGGSSAWLWLMAAVAARPRRARR